MRISGLEDLKVMAGRADKQSMVTDLIQHMMGVEVGVPDGAHPTDYLAGYWAAYKDILKELKRLA